MRSSPASHSCRRLRRPRPGPRRLGAAAATDADALATNAPDARRERAEPLGHLRGHVSCERQREREREWEWESTLWPADTSTSSKATTVLTATSNSSPAAPSVAHEPAAPAFSHLPFSLPAQETTAFSPSAFSRAKPARPAENPVASRLLQMPSQPQPQPQTSQPPGAGAQAGRVGISQPATATATAMVVPASLMNTKSVQMPTQLQVQSHPLLSTSLVASLQQGSSSASAASGPGKSSFAATPENNSGVIGVQQCPRKCSPVCLPVRVLQLCGAQRAGMGVRMFHRRWPQVQARSNLVRPFCRPLCLRPRATLQPRASCTS